MNKRGSAIVMFISILLMFISFIAFTPYLYPMVLENKTVASCTTDYGIECLLLDLSLPIVIIVLLSLLIGFVSRRIKR